MNIAPALTSSVANVSPAAPLVVSRGTTSLSSSSVEFSANSVYAAEQPSLPSVSRTSSSSSVTVRTSERSSVATQSADIQPDSNVVDDSEADVKAADEVSPDGSEQQAAEEQPGVASHTGERVEQGVDSASGLSEEEFRQITELASRDQEVRAHEQAHKSVGGQYTGAVSLSYQTGPNGKRYAIGGEVPIDVSPVSGDPLATIAKMRTVIAAARAPADPSPQDIKVASMAARQLARAQVELSVQKQEQNSSKETDDNVAQRANATSTYQEITGLIETEKSTVDEFA